MAEVEIEQADLSSNISKDKSAINLLRSARNRLLRATTYMRSPIDGQRHIPFDSKLLDAGAQLLTLLAKTSKTQLISDAAMINEILAIAEDFSASRAKLSAGFASRSISTSNEEIQVLLKREGQLVDQLIELRGAFTSRVVQLAKESSTKADTEAIQQRLSSILAQLEGIKQSLRAAMKADDQAIDQWTWIQSGLRPSDAVFQWIIHPAGNTIIYITHEGVRLHSIETKVPVIHQLADKLHSSASLRGIETINQLSAYPIKEAKQLYEILFGPVTHTLTAVDHWILVPPPLLDRLPWAALSVDSASPKSPEWLVERVALSITPSIRVWKQLNARKASTAKLSFLGIGDPLNTHTIDSTELQVRGSLVAALLPVSTVPDRTQTAFARELKSLANIYPPEKRTILSGKEATKKAFLELPLNNYKVIVFSTHGYLNGAVAQSLGPSLELTRGNGAPQDRFLSANEVATLQFDADLVVLSACDTSAGDGSSDAEGFSGLTSAFLLAGARSVVASLWPVETNATEALISQSLNIYATAKQHQSFAFALREAMRDAISDPRFERNHPSMWASFLVVGY